LLKNAHVPVLGFVAPSGTGKTTLLSKLIPSLKGRGLRVAVVKHTHHDFDIDKPGKDSYILRQAGANQTLIASKRRWALMVENDTNEDDVDLDEIIQQLDQGQLDLILVEGFKHSNFPKIEIFRSEKEHQPLFLSDYNIIAVACDGNIEEAKNIDVLDLNNMDEMLEYIVTRFDL
jgi:molybdopterin-guanine dinucleotide biosynthesis protein MobB